MKYYLEIIIRNKNLIEPEYFNYNDNDINKVIFNGCLFIRDLLKDDDMEYLYSQNNDKEFLEYYNLNFNILCINDHKPLFNERFDSKKEKFKLIYNQFLKTNNLFKSILFVADCRLYFDFEGNIKDCMWYDDDIHYDVKCIDNLDLNYYKYDNNTIVEYMGGVYLILGHSNKFNPEDILNCKIDVNHSYSMAGIRNNRFDYIRADEDINECEFSINISDDKKYLIDFVKNINNIIDASLNNNIINEDLITRKYYYWLATGEINYNLK